MGKLNINNGGVDTNKKMPDIDERFGPYTSIEAANAALGGQGRNTITAGLTVGILTANAGVKEYWYQPNKKSGILELIPKGGNASDNPTEGNFASFDENGNVVDSGNKATDFAPMEQAVPMGDEDDEGKILEKQKNGFGWVEKPADGDDAYGVYEKEYKAEHGGSTDGMLTRYEWLYSLKGDKGDNAINPFNGWLDSTDKLPDNPHVGDYAYVENNGTTYVYRCTTEGTWPSTSSEEKEPSNATFASAQLLNNVKIDDTHLSNPVGSDEDNNPTLAKAVDAMQLKQKIGDIDASVEKITDYEVVTGRRVTDETNYGYAGIANATEITLPIGTKKVRFLGAALHSGENIPSKVGYAFGTKNDDTWNLISYFNYDYSGTDTPYAKEYVADVPYGATHIRVTCGWRKNASTQPVLGESNFYFYAMKGDSVTDLIDKTHLGDSSENTVAKAEDVIPLKQKIGNIDFTETKAEIITEGEGQNVFEGKLTSNGTIKTANAYYKYYFITDIPEGTKSIRFRRPTGNWEGSGYALGNIEDDTFVPKRSFSFVSSQKTEVIIDVKDDETVFATQAGIFSANYNKYYLDPSNFYCYFQSGESISERFDREENNIATLKNYIDEELYDYISLSANMEHDNASFNVAKPSYYGKFAYNGTYKCYIFDLEQINGDIFLYTSSNWGATRPLIAFASELQTNWPPSSSDVFRDIAGFLGWGYTFTQKYDNEKITIPEGAKYLYLCVSKNYKGVVELRQKSDKSRIDLLENVSNKLMKVVVGNNTFRVRTKFSDTEDIIIVFKERILAKSDIGSQSLTLDSYFVGTSDKTDNEIMNGLSSTGNSPNDSISTFSFVGFGPMSAQHGWSIARVAKTGLQINNDDLNSIWEDKNKANRTFILGYIDDNYIYFFPQITETDGIYGTTTGSVFSTPPEGFIYVSGVAVHTNPINVASERYDLRVQSSKWDYIVDGVKVGAGTYYCNDFVFTEHIKVFNPANVDYDDWFEDQTDAKYNNEMFMLLSRSFVFKGYGFAYNLTINTVYPFKLSVFDLVFPKLPIAVTENGITYHANLLVPKCKGIATPYINDSGMVDGGAHYVYRNNESNGVYNTDDLPDRAICFLKSDSNEYKIGMAGGFSLTRGITTKAQRNQLLEHINEYTGTDRKICYFGNDDDTKNKFYNKVLIGKSFENTIVPTTFVKEACAYICWFNPNGNPGLQVYSYKEDDGYVIYIHGQQAYEKKEVNLPEYLEGLVVDSIIEKTAGATLLTSQVICGKLYIKFKQNNGNDYSVNDNYIVLKVK